MQEEQLKDLVIRFLDGNTTLDEEKRLYDYFSRTKQVSEALLPYAEYFRDLAVLPPPQKAVRKRMKPIWTRRWVRMAVGTAAAALLVVGGM